MSARAILARVDKMEIKHMHIVIALTLIFLGAVYFFLEESAKPPGPLPEEIAEQLHLSAISLGENSTGYAYSYTEYSDGYPENFTLKSDGSTSLVEIVNPLSKKMIYFTSNGTILCVDFSGKEACSSLANDTITTNYIASMKARLFSKSKISDARSDTMYRIEHELQTYLPSVKTRILQSGDQCSQIGYVIDYTNATLEELSRFGMVPGSPSHFEATACIENLTGEVFESYFNYTFSGSLRTNRFVLISSDFDSSPLIIVPSNLTDGAVDLLISENGYRMQLVGCYLKSASEQEKCIANLALQMNEPDLCEDAGSRRDRCFVSIVPITKDSSLCSRISSQEFKDDCFIELGGAYKNSTWCESVVDSTKQLFCQNVSVKTVAQAVPEINAGANESQNASANTTGKTLPPEIQAIFDEIEAQDQTGNQTNETG